ncbi:hypothetical protein [Burkholderia arboris]|uniref:hypothetical protein n=1 Tax=Burkholderia arboris TaxID=488730 RepID=UPI00210B1C23|nr:hypothetical protein [Burkholderia arboris]UTV58975.1 hypothetical protein NLX30_22845 [Burkholderia arboris]
MRAALRLRGVMKLTIVAIAVAHALTFAFEGLLLTAGFAPDAAAVLLFRFVTCARQLLAAGGCVARVPVRGATRVRHGSRHIRRADRRCAAVPETLARRVESSARPARIEW